MKNIMKSSATILLSAIFAMCMASAALAGGGHGHGGVDIDVDVTVNSYPDIVQVLEDSYIVNSMSLYDFSVYHSDMNVTGVAAGNLYSGETCGTCVLAQVAKDVSVYDSMSLSSFTVKGGGFNVTGISAGNAVLKSSGAN